MITGHFITTQAIGFIAFGLGVAALLSQNDQKLKLLLTAQCCVLSLHFELLGASTAAIVAIISALRNYVSLYAMMKPISFAFIFLYMFMGYFRYEEWVDVLPIIGCVISTIGIFFLTKIPMRLCMSCTTSLWIIHNAVLISIGPLLMELCMLVVNIHTIWTLYYKKHLNLSDMNRSSKL